MNKRAQKTGQIFITAVFSAVLLLGIVRTVQAGIDATYTGHDYVSVTSALSVTEVQAIRFGNFAVTSPGGGDASITLSDTGTRTVTNGVSTTISLLNGGYSDMGSQSAGDYQVTGATAGATIYVSFTDNAGTVISSSNPVVLTGPVGSGTFNVDTMTFNQSGSDATGPYIIAGTGGTASIQVGATLHTVSGVTTYAPGTYRGTFNLLLSY